MVLYLTTILVCMAIISVLNILLGTSVYGYSPWQVIGLVTIAVVIEIAIDLVLAGIFHALPSKWYDPDKKCFCVSKKERKFYEKIGIKKWKDKILELGALGGFRKNKLKDSSDCEYLNLFLIENNKGIVIHISNIILGFLIMLCLPLKYAWVISFPVACVNFVLGLLPIFVLRYNIPKLKICKQRAERNKEQEPEI